MVTRVKDDTFLRIAGLAILLFVAPTSQAEPASLVSNLAATAAPLPDYSISFVTADAEDTDIFHVPLIGDFNRMGFRTATSDGGKFDDLHQYALFLDFNLPASWSPWPAISADPRLTFEIGRFKLGDEGRSFASLGPAVRFTNQLWRMPMYLDLRLSPTLFPNPFAWPFCSLNEPLNRRTS